MSASTPRGGSFIVDTSVAIAVLNEEAEATARWDAAGGLILPAPVSGELLYGANCSNAPADNARRVLGLLRQARLAPVDRLVCEESGWIKSHLRRLGRPIPENDLWTAAVCRALGLPLASRDAHFDVVPDLVRDEWR